MESWFLLFFSSPGTAGRRPVQDLQTFRCFALHQGPAGLHALGQDTGQWLNLSAGSGGKDNHGWLHVTFCFVPPRQSQSCVHLFRDAFSSFVKLTEHPQRSWLTVINCGGNSSSPIMSFFFSLIGERSDSTEIPKKKKSYENRKGFWNNSREKAHIDWPSFKTTTSLPCPGTPLWKRVYSIMFSGRSPAADLLLLPWLTFSFSSWSRRLLRCENILFFVCFCSPLCLSLTSHWWSFLKRSTFSLSSLKYVLHSRSDSLGNLRSSTVWNDWPSKLNRIVFNVDETAASGDKKRFWPGFCKML